MEAAGNTPDPDNDGGLEAVPDLEEGAALVIEGDGQIGMKVGGRKPDSAVMKLKGAKLDLKGQFDRGDRITAVAVLQVVGDNDQDTIDTASGEVQSTSKAQSATLCGFTEIREYLERKIEDQDLLTAVVEALEL